MARPRLHHRTYDLAVQHRSRKPSILVVLAAALLLVAVAGCGSSTPASGPAAVVHQALDRLAAKDLDGLRSLACAGQEDQIRNLLQLPVGTGSGSGAGLLPGVDTQALLDAVQVDVGDVKVGEATIDGDTAEVALTGSVKVTFDSDTLRPIIRQVLDQQGASMTDEQLDALLSTLQSYGQDVPLDQSVRLVQESGDWKICQDSIALPGAS
jgi:uncharacterized lipoprotein